MGAWLIILLALWLSTPAWSATIGSDDFTGTNGALLNARACGGVSGCVGGTWTTTIGGENFMMVNNNTLWVSGTTAVSRARKADNIGADEMNVQATASIHDLSTSRRSGVCGRVNPSGLTTNIGICAVLHGNTTDVVVRLINHSTTTTYTEIGTGFGGLAQNTAYTIRLEVRAAGHTVYVNGTPRVTGVDNSYTGQNFAGVLLNSNANANTFIDNFVSESVAAASARRAIIINSLQPWPFKAPEEWYHAFLAWIRHR